MLRVTTSIAYTVYHKTTIVYITTVHEWTKEWTYHTAQIFPGL